MPACVHRDGSGPADFPHKIAAARICTTEWHEDADVAAAGAEVSILAGVCTGNVEALERDVTLLHDDSNLLSQMRAACLRVASTLTWARAGGRVQEVYGRIVA